MTTFRPDHEHFWLMCQAIKDLDGASDRGVDFRAVIGDVDIDSLMYTSEQRALRATMILGDPIPREAQVISAWADGFMIGARFRKLADQRKE